MKQWFLILLFTVISGWQAHLLSQEHAPPLVPPTEEIAPPLVPPTEEIAPPPPSPLYEELYREAEEIEPTDFRAAFLRMLGILLLMVIALLVLSWMSKKFLQQRTQFRNKESDIQIIDSRPISSKATIHFISIQGIGFAVGESASGLISLGKIPIAWEKEKEEE